MNKKSTRNRKLETMCGVALAVALFGFSSAVPAQAESMSGGVFGGSCASNSGGPENSSAFSNASSLGHTMGATKQHSNTNGIGPSHTYSGGTYAAPGTPGTGFSTHQSYYTGHNNPSSTPTSNAQGPANPTPAASYQPTVRNYIGQNTSSTSATTTYSWGINSRLLKTNTIHR
ncbi:MAG: hypothetical protein R3D26_20325 [Cyanobacteriota/Melainabacteria group bacterium]